MTSFSIIIPVHNDPLHYLEAIESVRRQSLTETEIIVVDDGSDEPIPPVDDERLTIIRHDEPRGPAAARNAGIRAATGDVIGFLDSDDLYGPERLAQVAEVMPTVDFAVVGAATVAIEPVDLRTLLWSTTPHLGSLTIWRSVMTDLGGFDESYLACQDVELWVRICEARLRGVRVDSDQFIFRPDDRPRLLNGTSARLRFNRRLLQDHKEFFASNRRARAFRHRRVHVYAAAEAQYGDALRALALSAFTWPSPRTMLDAARLARHRVRRHDER